MTTAVAFLAALCMVASLLSADATALGASFLPASGGMSCAGVCSQQGLTSAFLVGTFNGLQTSVCEANVTGMGRLSGYQQGGVSTCVVASNGAVQEMSEYSCLCLDSTAQGGLVTSQSTACSSSCNQGFDGLTGSAIALDSSEPSYACLPASEIGVSNRFGYTTQLSADAVICTSALNGSAAATPQFSCYCSFSTGSSQSSSSPAPSSSASAPSTLAVDNSAVQSLSQGADAISAGGRRLLSQ